MSIERQSIKTRKRVGVWIRVSTEDQAKGDSPQHHEQRARDYAKFNDWEVCEVYDLAGVSGKSVMEHPEAKRMLADLKRDFASVRHVKPAASRPGSAELYVLATGFRGAN